MKKQIELAKKKAQEAEQAMVLRMRQAIVSATCDATKNICVRWQNPEQSRLLLDPAKGSACCRFE